MNYNFRKQPTKQRELLPTGNGQRQDIAIGKPSPLTPNETVMQNLVQTAKANSNPATSYAGPGYQTTKDGQYQSAYSSMIDDLVNKAINREAFSYDPATDPAYQSYARMYTRLGDEAGRNTLADVANNTGGLASSYAVTASNQARSAYNQALTDKIPELMQIAYDRYRNDYNDALAGLNALQGLDDSMYNRFATDRSYNRGVYESDRDFNESVRQYNQNYDLDKNSAEFERMLNTWATMGYANSTVAKYFGVPEGTRTDDSQYKWAQFALSQAKSSGSGSSGRRRSSSGSGSGTDDGLSDQDKAYIAKGETNQAINVLNQFGKYLAQGGMTPEKQASALRTFKTSSMFTNLNEYEQAYVLARLNGYQP